MRIARASPAVRQAVPEFAPTQKRLISPGMGAATNLETRDWQTSWPSTRPG